MSSDRGPSKRWSGQIHESEVSPSLPSRPDEQDKLLKDIRAFCYQATQIVQQAPDAQTLESADLWQQEYAAERIIVGIATALQRLENHVPNFRNDHPELPWKAVIGMRDRLSHGYDDINVDIVWNVIATDLPKLDAQIAIISQQ